MVTIKQARSVSQEIVKQFHPVSVTVFGSVARTGKGNDLDIMVVIDAVQGPPEELSHRIQSRLSHWYKQFSIDPIVVTNTSGRTHLKNGSPFLSAIIDEGVLVYMRDAINEWKKNADEDCAMAKYLLKGNFFRGACYNAQQAVEKILKARLLEKGWQLEKIHNIRRLATICGEYNIPVPLTDKEISFLDSIYRCRYPAEIGLLPEGEPGSNDAELAIECAERIIGRTL